MRPRASVIVCVLDDFRVLRLLESLEAQRVERSLFEVVLVRAGREDYGSLLSRFDLSMKTVFSPTARLPVQRNLGVRAADGEFLLTTDADCVADAAWVGAMIRHLEDSPDDVAAVGGSIKKYATRSIVQRFGITIDDGQAGVNYLPALHLPYVTGANSAYRAAAVREVGGYDEQFVCGDDVDMSYRLGLAGYRLSIEPAATIYHEDRVTLGQHYRRFRGYAIDQALLFKKYRDVSGSTWKVNDHPWRRLRYAAGLLARGALAAPRGDWSLPAAALVTATEAVGVLAGDVAGSIRHRVPYL